MAAALDSYTQLCSSIVYSLSYIFFAFCFFLMFVILYIKWPHHSAMCRPACTHRAIFLFDHQLLRGIFSKGKGKS